MHVGAELKSIPQLRMVNRAWEKDPPLTSFSVHQRALIGGLYTNAKVPWQMVNFTLVAAQKIFRAVNGLIAKIRTPFAHIRLVPVAHACDSQALV